MKALFSYKEGITGWSLVEFKPIANDWYSWKTHDKQLKLIHERCYFAIALQKDIGLPFVAGEGVCAKCGVEAPESVQQFILFATKVRGYDEGRTEE